MSIVRFHAAVLGDTGLAADFSLADAVHAREKACGYRFLPAIVEWYSLKGSVELLEACREGNAGRGGRIVPLDQLGELAPNDPETPYRGYLQLYRAGEDDFAIYALLNGNEDPPVFVDDCEIDDEDLFVPKFFPYQPTYSAFVLDWVRRGLGRIDPNNLP